MNAFQLGIACFKQTESGEVISRPFNIWAFPHSDVLGNQTLQFKCSNIAFLMNNKFDFNKLFKEGVNYQRLSDGDRVRAIIEQNAKWKCEFPQSYAPWRQYTKLGSKSTELLADLLRRI